MVRRGIALIVNHGACLDRVPGGGSLSCGTGFAATPEGQKDFLYKVATIAGSVQETCDQAGIVALLRAKSEYKHHEVPPLTRRVSRALPFAAELPRIAFRALSLLPLSCRALCSVRPAPSLSLLPLSCRAPRLARTDLSSLRCRRPTCGTATAPTRRSSRSCGASGSSSTPSAAGTTSTPRPSTSCARTASSPTRESRRVSARRLSRRAGGSCRRA